MFLLARFGLLLCIIEAGLGLRWKSVFTRSKSSYLSTSYDVRISDLNSCCMRNRLGPLSLWETRKIDSTYCYLQLPRTPNFPLQSDTLTMKSNTNRYRSTRLNALADPDLDGDEIGLPNLFGDEDEDEDEEDEDGDDDEDDDDDDIEFGFETASSQIEKLAEFDMESDNENAPSAGTESVETMTWAEKRQRKLEGGMKKTKKSWEAQFEDDPLRSESPTVDLDIVPYIPYTNMYILLADVQGSEMLLKRGEAWTHHLQWVRRNTLTATEAKRVHVEWDYTRLSSDSLYPTGQVLAVRGNTTEDVLELLRTEPLVVHGGISSWKMYEYHPLVHENTSCTITDPYLFVGNHKSKVDLQEDELEKYYGESNKRVISMGELHAVDAGKGKKFGDEYLIVFNSRTAKGAEKYLQEGPLVKSGSVDLKASTLTPINIQDTNGLHHVMGRSFIEARELNKIHFLDPSDLLMFEVAPLPNLPDHVDENNRVLSMLETENRKFRYVRHNYLDHFESLKLVRDHEAYKMWAYDLQKARLSVSDTVSEDSEVISGEEAQIDTDFGGDE